MVWMNIQRIVLRYRHRKKTPICQYITTAGKVRYGQFHGFRTRPYPAACCLSGNRPGEGAEMDFFVKSHLAGRPPHRDVTGCTWPGDRRTVM